MTFTDPGDQKKGRSRKPAVRAPDAPNLFDISSQAPPTPIQVTSSTSIDAAKEIKEGTMSARRNAVLRAVTGAPYGLARFQVAGVLKMPDHWITSAVLALIEMRKIEEHPTLTVINPKSGKTCAVLIAIQTAEDAAA